MILMLVALLAGFCAPSLSAQVDEDRLYRIVSPSGLAIDNRLNPDNLGNLVSRYGRTPFGLEGGRRIHRAVSK